MLCKTHKVSNLFGVSNLVTTVPRGSKMADSVSSGTDLYSDKLYFFFLCRPGNEILLLLLEGDLSTKTKFETF